MRRNNDELETMLQNALSKCIEQSKIDGVCPFEMFAEGLAKIIEELGLDNLSEVAKRLDADGVHDVAEVIRKHVAEARLAT
ncbi:hypothetical protein GURASL_30270 [Geotalea uraniireducens]|uniref:Uncharacterized protein n=1 Tax=Geotalea uraniireducens TaxID=351604 RepID=A0ABN6VXB0_9BACT|nr:hypothetical protein [Geotalea uraniireducens]BDV44104.1 hypothetical protein GURASL_30270 [Geotalea uraniireducens]